MVEKSSVKRGTETKASVKVVGEKTFFIFCNRRILALARKGIGRKRPGPPMRKKGNGPEINCPTCQGPGPSPAPPKKKKGGEESHLQKKEPNAVAWEGLKKNAGCSLSAGGKNNG